MNLLREDIATVLCASRFRGDLLSLRITGERSASMIFDTEEGFTEVSIYSHPDGDKDIVVDGEFEFAEIYPADEEA